MAEDVKYDILGTRIVVAEVPELERQLATVFAFSQTGDTALKGWWNYLSSAREALNLVRTSLAKGES